MARLPSSFRRRNRTTEAFRKQFAALPPNIQKSVRQMCLLFNEDPFHRSLRRHVLEDRREGKHAPQSVSISITMQYRAIYVEVDGTNVWYWIGTHAQYKVFTAGKS